MTTQIPRAEIHAIAARYGVDYDIDDDPAASLVREWSASLRRDPLDEGRPAAILAEADELDALVDRIEGGQ